MATMAMSVENRVYRYRHANRSTNKLLWLLYIKYLVMYEINNNASSLHICAYYIH